MARWLAGIAGAVIAGLLVFFITQYISGRPANSPPPEVEASGDQPAPAPTEVNSSTGPASEEISEQIKEQIAQGADEMEGQLRQQYDKKLGDLDTQLEVVKRDAEARRQRERELREEAKEEEAARAAEAARIAQEEAATAEAMKQALEEEAAKLAMNPDKARETQVSRGDLVLMGPGVVPPRLLLRPQPRFPEVAKRLNKKSAKVLVKVLIDENGKVIKAELAGKSAGYGFDDEALASARKSTYEPATKNGVSVKYWHTLAVEFRDK